MGGRGDGHPSWCGRGHVCSAERRGEHRSYPVAVDTPSGRVVMTRIRTTSGRDRVEVRVVVDLPADPAAGRRFAAVAMVRVCRALGGRLGRAA